MKINALRLTSKNIFKSDKKNTKILEEILVNWVKNEKWNMSILILITSPRLPESVL